MAKKERLIVVGGVAAGMSAAAKARRINPHIEIVVYEKSGYISYGACGFPYYIKGEVADIESLLARTPAQMAEQGVMAHTRHEVQAIDAGRRIAAIYDHTTGRKRFEPWDKLILAAGASMTRPSIPGINLNGIFTLRTVEDALAIRRWLEETKPRHGVIVGGGYIGLEMAEALAAHGVAVTIVDAADQLMSSLDVEIAALIQAELAAAGIEIRLDEMVQSFIGERLVTDITRRVTALVQGQGGGGVNGHLRVREVVTDKQSYPADLIIFGVGSRPNVALAQQAGVKLGKTSAVAVDARQRTNVPNIWAAGAVAEAFHRVLGQPIYFPLAQVASKQGRVAAVNAAGGEASFAGTVGTAVVKTFDLEVAQTGLSEKAARTKDWDVDSVTIEATSRAHYMPGQAPIHLKLVFDKNTQRVLGSQMIGKEGVAQRINVIAAALQAEWTIRDLAGLDLAYAPPFAPVWDPILVAANVANRD
ncbi:MAG: FAD-dependent oxidoreductase [Chloroflexota bacterium]